jgi:hypothetical protein
MIEVLFSGNEKLFVEALPSCSGFPEELGLLEVIFIRQLSHLRIFTRKIEYLKRSY